MARETAPLHVVGIGSMVVDRVHRARRILGADEKAILRDLEGEPVRMHVGGVVLNHLGWAAALGLRVGIFGRQADDEGGRFLRAAMDSAGIAHQISLDGSASSLAEIFVDDAGARSIYMAPGATSETTPEQVRTLYGDFIRRGARLSTEVSQLPLAATREALRVARAAGIPTVVDLDVPPEDALATLGDEDTLLEILGMADLLKPSKIAVRALVEAPDDDDTLALARAVRARFGNAAVVLTDGERGCAISADDFEGTVDAFPVKAIDTTGAGDAFLGGLLVALHHGLAWPDAGALANACGAACAEQVGAFPEDADAARRRVLARYSGPALDLHPTAAVPEKAEPAPGSDREAALQVLAIGARELAALSSRHDGIAFAAAGDLIQAAQKRGGRVHVTGVGKPAHVAHYAASLLSSTGTPATFLDPIEALHGSLGQVGADDIVVAISNSGETAELRATVEVLRGQGVRIIAVTGRPDSWLGINSDVVLEAGVGEEGGPLGLAPRSSVAAESLVVAALGALLQERAGFTKADYAARHPAGALGRKARKE